MCVCVCGRGLRLCGPSLHPVPWLLEPCALPPVALSGRSLAAVTYFGEAPGHCSHLGLASWLQGLASGPGPRLSLLRLLADLSK